MKYTLELNLEEAQKIRRCLDSSQDLLWATTTLTGSQDLASIEELKKLSDKVNQAIEIKLFGEINK